MHIILPCRKITYVLLLDSIGGLWKVYEKGV